MGVILTTVGATSLTVGLAKYELAGLCSVDTYPYDTRCADEGRATAGAIMGVGAAVLAAGVIMIVVNETRVDFGREPSKRLTPGLALTPRGLVF
jgi:hypothetical protein